MSGDEISAAWMLGSDKCRAPVGELMRVPTRVGLERVSRFGQRVGQSFETAADVEVVGVADTKYDSVRNAPPPTMYVPCTSSGSSAR